MFVFYNKHRDIGGSGYNKYEEGEIKRETNNTRINPIHGEEIGREAFV